MSEQEPIFTDSLQVVDIERLRGVQHVPNNLAVFTWYALRLSVTRHFSDRKAAIEQMKEWFGEDYSEFR